MAKAGLAKVGFDHGVGVSHADEECCFLGHLGAGNDTQWQENESLSLKGTR